MIKHISYYWNWNYNPIQKQKDRIAIAFSKGFEIIQSSAHANYRVQSKKHIQGAGSSALYWYPTNITESKTIFTKNGSDVSDEITPTIGMGHTFQLNDYYTKPGDAYTERYYSYSHSGSFWFNVEKYYNSTVNDSFTAKAEYWYKTAVINFCRSSFDYIIISESI